jgi:outer membrane cobalamin receptor
MTMTIHNTACILIILAFTTAVFAQEQPPHTLSGSIREAESNEAVIGVSVFLTRDTSAKAQTSAILRGARTNKVGFFSLLDVPEGAYFLVVRGVGYATLIRRVSIPEEKPLSLTLSRQTATLGQVTVRATGDLREAVQSISRVDIQAETIARLPSFGGQKDVFRALQLLPGIQTASELSSGLYVRGGSPDQNLTLLDGALIYNPSHLAGFFSTFNADALQDIRLYKGAFPAEYGGRLSSVIDLTMREGSAKRVKGNATLSTIIAEANLEGPIVSSNATFMLSGRRMILDWLVEAQKALTDNIPQDAPLPLYYFYDINAKLSYKLSDQDRIFLSLYNGRDNLGFDASGLSLGLGWGNLSGNLRWAHVVSPSLFTNFSLIYTKYDYTTSIAAPLGRSRLRFSTLSQIEDWTLKAEAAWNPSAAHSIKTGIEAIRHTFRNTVGTRIEPSAVGIGTSETDGQLTGTEAGLFAQDEWQVSERLLLNLGFRASWFQAGGRFNIEPRLSAGYALTDDVRLTASFSVVNQYVHLLSRNDISLPSDIWLPATQDILPARALQYTLGAEMPLLDGELKFSAEAYYKTMQNLYEYREGAVLNTLNINRLSDQLTSGSGEGYGVEFLLEKKSGALTGWLGYTLSWAQRTFLELNGGRAFAPRYDRRHNIALALTYVLDDQWEFGATWTFVSGQPITLPAGQANLPDITGTSLQTGAGGNPTPSYYFTERNGSRMTPFHKLDLSATIRTVIFIFPGEYYISIYNAYNNMNPFAWIISTQTSPDAPGMAKPVVQQLTIFPILPTVGMRIKF